MINLKTLQNKGFNYICGIDEAGRGPLAGPLSLTFFLIPINDYKKVLNILLKKGLNDSKKIKEKKREELYNLLNKKYYFNSMISASLIDKYGLSKCMKILIKRLIKRIENSNINLDKTYFLLDGAIKFSNKYSNEIIIGGDGIEPVIMAASIVSKVKRDRRMKKLAKKYPKYNFDVHKGYGTLIHRKAIKKYGLSKEHRESFCKNFR